MTNSSRAINDLDETLPAPWEWDVKRLAASFVVASRDNGLMDTVARDVAALSVRTYREWMARHSELKTLRGLGPAQEHVARGLHHPVAVHDARAVVGERARPRELLERRACGRALALSHARSGLAATLSGYMGKSDAFDEAIATFAVAYADQNEKDHAALARAVRSGKVKAAAEEPR